MDIGFMAVETFIPTEEYIEWCGLTQVKEVITLECALCPHLIKEFSDEDYNNLIWMEDVAVFKNLDSLLDRVHYFKDKQILAVIREPQTECKDYNFDNRLNFMDIIYWMMIHALVL